MEARIQRLLHSDGSPATMDQEMAYLLKKTFHGLYRANKKPTSTFHPRTEVSMANTLIMGSETQPALIILGLRNFEHLVSKSLLPIE